MTFQPRQPPDLPDWWLGWAGVKEPTPSGTEWRFEQGGAPPDGILGSLLDRRSDSPDS